MGIDVGFNNANIHNRLTIRQLYEQSRKLYKILEGNSYIEMYNYMNYMVNSNIIYNFNISNNNFLEVNFYGVLHKCIKKLLLPFSLVEQCMGLYR